MKIGIMGGGVGALTSALLLLSKGYEVTIFEKSHRLGGRLAFEESGPYKVDQGPTIVLLPNMLLGILQEAGLSEKEIPLKRLDPLYTIHYRNGKSYTKHGTFEKQLEEIQEKFPNDVEGYKQFLLEMKERFELGHEYFLSKAFPKKRDFWTFENLSLLWKLRAHQSVYKMVDQYFEAPELRQAYSLQTLYIGGNPITSPGMYGLIAYSEQDHGVYYLQGGYASLVPTLEREIRKRGGSIHLGAEVEKVLLDGKKVTGLRVKGTVETFDAVVLNGDFPNAMEAVSDKVKKYTPSSGALLLYLGLSKRYDDQPVHQFFLGENFEKNMNEVFGQPSWPSDPSIYTFNPSKIDSSLAPEGHSVLYALIPVPTDLEFSNVEVNQYVENILDELAARGFADIREHIEWRKVRTPKDSQEDGLYGGGSFGIAPTLLQSGPFRPQVKVAGYDNLYAVGASIHPGGGVPIVMQGAKLMVDLLSEEMSLGREREHDEVARLSLRTM